MMFATLFKSFYRDRRAATALIVVLMAVPLILLCGSAVDFSRVAAARAQLQAAADAAAVAGVGTYKNDQSNSNARSTANATFTATIANLTAYSLISTPAVTAICSGSNLQCGGVAPNGSCVNTVTYCVTVKASASLSNSLLGAFIPRDAMSVSATAETNANSPGNCPNCITTTSSTGLQPGGGGGIIFSAYHIAGSGTGNPTSPNNNTGSPVANFDVFLNGNNKALPAAGSYVAPSKNSTDPCTGSATLLAGQLVTAKGTPVYDVNNNIEGSCSTSSCSLPGATYCGSLTIDGNVVNLNLTGTMSASGIYVEDGDMFISPSATIFNSNTGNAAGQYVPIFFGGNNAGSLILQQETQIDPSGMSSGTIEYISTFYSQNVQDSSTSTNLEAGVCQDADAYCTSGSVNAGAVKYSGAGTVIYSDTYDTIFTVTSGAESHWKQTEYLAMEFLDSSNNPIVPPTTQTVEYDGDYPANMHDSSSVSSAASYTLPSISPSSTLTCPNNAQPLYSFTTTGSGSGSNPNLGYSYASPNLRGYGTLAETIFVCGVGSALAATGGGGTGSYVGPSGTSTNPVLIN